MHIQRSFEVACAADHLWQFIEDPERQKQWMKGLLENRSTSEGPTRAGSTFSMKMKEGGKVKEYEGEVTAYDKPRHLGVRFWGGVLQPGTAIRCDYRLTDLGDKTRLDYDCLLDAEKLGWLMKLFMPVIQWAGSMQAMSLLKKLKKVAEAPKEKSLS